MNESVIRIVGQSAYANGILMIANLVTLMLMFILGEPWGWINDNISVFWALSFIPLAIVFYQVNKPVGGGGSLIAAVVGIMALLVFAGLQTMLVLRQVRFEQTFTAVVVAGGVMGLWLLLNGLLARQGQTLPASLIWLTILFGLGYIMAAIGYGLGGYESPILWFGSLIGFVLGPVWAFWQARLLLKNRLVMPA
jgi:hypothetical protein